MTANMQAISDRAKGDRERKSYPTSVFLRISTNLIIDSAQYLQDARRDEALGFSVNTIQVVPQTALLGGSTRPCRIAGTVDTASAVWEPQTGH